MAEVYGDDDIAKEIGRPNADEATITKLTKDSVAHREAESAHFRREWDAAEARKHHEKRKRAAEDSDCESSESSSSESSGDRRERRRRGSRRAARGPGEATRARGRASGLGDY